MTPTDTRVAANSARQLVRQAIDLQALDAVLQDLATKANFLAEADLLVGEKQAALEQLAKRVADAETAAADAEARAGAEYANAVAQQRAAVAALRTELEDLEGRRETATTDAMAAEARLAAARDALKRVTAAVG